MQETPSAKYAVIFTNQRTKADPEGYEAMAEKMVTLAKKQKGYLDMASVRDDSGLGITISYWDSLEAVRAWKENLEHQEAQREGIAGWYESYSLHVARVEREKYWTNS